MSSNPFSAVAVGVSSGLTFIIKLCEYTYALRAVDQQTGEYLSTASHAWENVLECRRLLSLRKDQLPLTEQRSFQRVINDATKAAREVARLLEPARVDVDADDRIRFSTRVMWVLRDDPAIGAALRRLDIVHTTLTQNISTLRLMRSSEDSSILSRSQSNKEKPPDYESSQLLHWKRQTRLTPKPSTDTLSTDMPSRPHSVATSRPADPANLPTKVLAQPRELPPEMPGDFPERRHVSWPLDSAIPQVVISTSETDSQSERSVGSSRPQAQYRARSWLEHQALKARAEEQLRRRWAESYT